MYQVLLVSLDGWNTTAEIPYILGEAGCQVDVLCTKDDWLKSNSYYTNWIEAETNEAQFLIQLAGLGRQSFYDWIILCDEPLQKLVIDHVKDENLLRKLLPLQKIENRSLLGSKVGLALNCQIAGILIPGFYIIEKPGEHNYPDMQLNFPLIIKEDYGWGGKNISVARNQQELISAINLQTEKVIVQEFIKGKEVPVEALYINGKLCNYTVSEIMEYDKNEFSYSTRRKYLGSDDLQKTLVDLGEKLGINGFANIAYIRSDVDGRYYLLEADLRPNSWMSYSRFNGRSFSTALRKLLANQDAGIVNEPDYSRGKEVEIVLFHKDIRRCFYKRDAKGFLKWLVNYHNCWRFIPFYDKRLLRRVMSELMNELVVDKFKTKVLRRKAA